MLSNEPVTETSAPAPGRPPVDEPRFPPVIRLKGRLYVRRNDLNRYEAELVGQSLGVPPVYPPPVDPDPFVPAKDVCAELGFGRRTFGRRELEVAQFGVRVIDGASRNSESRPRCGSWGRLSCAMCRRRSGKRRPRKTTRPGPKAPDQFPLETGGPARRALGPRADYGGGPSDEIPF